MACRLAANLLGVLASLQHIGRRSGQEYVTPVLAVPFGDGFVVPLAYGRSVDWFRNVMVAHGCKLVEDVGILVRYFKLLEMRNGM